MPAHNEENCQTSSKEQKTKSSVHVQGNKQPPVEKLPLAELRSPSGQLYVATPDEIPPPGPLDHLDCNGLWIGTFKLPVTIVSAVACWKWLPPAPLKPQCSLMLLVIPVSQDAALA